MDPNTSDTALPFVLPSLAPSDHGGRVLPWRASVFTTLPGTEARELHAGSGSDDAEAGATEAHTEEIQAFRAWAASIGARVQDHTVRPGSGTTSRGVPGGGGPDQDGLLALSATGVAEAPEGWDQIAGLFEGSAFVTGPAAEPGPKAFAFDVDSTLIEEEVIELLAAHAGRQEEVAAITARAMRGEIDFAESLRERVSALAGLPVSVLADVAEAVTPTRGALSFIGTATAAGHRVGAVSGGFSQVLDVHAADWGLDAALANELEVADGHLSGRVCGGIVTAETKREFLERLAVRAADGTDLTVARIAVGDGANDLEMVKAAELGVGLCAKPKLAEAADVRLDVRDLRALAAIVCLDLR